MSRCNFNVSREKALKIVFVFVIFSLIRFKISNTFARENTRTENN